MPGRRLLGRLCVAFTLCLIVLGLAWELWLAPVRPGGSWLVLKVVPLLLPLGGLVHGKPYTFQWTSMLCLLYVVEALVRLVTGHGTEAVLAGVELALAGALFCASIAFVRSAKP
jgi:uncharacterized membrane protein